MNKSQSTLITTITIYPDCLTGQFRISTRCHFSHIIADFSQLSGCLVFFVAFRSEFWSVKFVEIGDLSGGGVSMETKNTEQ